MTNYIGKIEFFPIYTLFFDDLWFIWSFQQDFCLLFFLPPFSSPFPLSPEYLLLSGITQSISPIAFDVLSKASAINVKQLKQWI